MTDQPTDQPIGLTLDQAALALGISREAVRLRLRRGTLDGIRTGREWCVYLAGRSVDHSVRPTKPTNQPTDQAPRPTRQRRTVPARDREVQRLEEMAVDLRSRVTFLEERIVFYERQVEHQAGVIADLSKRLPEPAAASPAPGLDGLITALQENAAAAPQRPSWWRRLLGRA